MHCHQNHQNIESHLLLSVVLDFPLFYYKVTTLLFASVFIYKSLKSVMHAKVSTNLVGWFLSKFNILKLWIAICIFSSHHTNDMLYISYEMLYIQSYLLHQFYNKGNTFIISLYNLVVNPKEMVNGNQRQKCKKKQVGFEFCGSMVFLQSNHNLDLADRVLTFIIGLTVVDIHWYSGTESNCLLCL